MPSWSGARRAEESSTDGGLVPRGAVSPGLRDEERVLDRKTLEQCTWPRDKEKESKTRLRTFKAQNQG